MFKKYLPVIIILVGVIVAGIILVNSKKTPDQNSGAGLSNGEQETVVDEFEGEKGEQISLADGKVEIDAEILDDGLARYYNVNLSNGDIIYFFVVKDKGGVYRAAANACQVCFGSKMGFRQEGDNMICNTCNNAYPLEKIATEKGGCNPGPINPNLEVKDGKITILESELEEVSGFFN